MGPTTEEAKTHIKWWYDRREDHLYQQSGGLWERWKKEVRRVRSAGFILAQREADIPPPHAHPATVTQVRRSATVYLEGFDRHTGFGQQRGEENEPPDATNLAEHMRRMDEDLQWVVARCTLPADDGKAIAARL